MFYLVRLVEVSNSLALQVITEQTKRNVISKGGVKHIFQISRSQRVIGYR